ncbi:hypothetical protein G3I48_30235 [Streptomyces griseus]|uniref:hypothetical protein n=1 Tax=Streptomyces griseus TaxID=1911 RepID=UPI0013B94892|nr:hypothetical protein [Streptomyces griseus]
MAPKPALIHDCLQSGRQDVHLGTLFQDRFPDLVAAAARLPPGLFLLQLDGQPVLSEPTRPATSSAGRQSTGMLAT